MIHPSVVCFGEVLWDLLPSGKVVGGAPLNVAYHLQRLGTPSSVISQVGSDVLGIQLKQFLKDSGIGTELLKTNYTFSTGVVGVQLNEAGSPTYNIVEPVAWDFIHAGRQEKEAVQKAACLVYGSLAARSRGSREALKQLLTCAAFRVMDVNLRAPFFEKELLLELLTAADAVKMSAEELEIIGTYFGLQGSLEARIATLREQLGLRWLLLTMGEAGSLLQLPDQRLFQEVYSVEVIDTVGCGDAFLAGFVSAYLSGQSYADGLRKAASLGALVATHAGANPAYTLDDLTNLLTITTP